MSHLLARLAPPAVTDRPGAVPVLSRHLLGLALLDWLIVAGLALVTLVTHAPMRTRVLAFWDSILYARALQEFTIVAHQPQPPGYFFYVMAGRLARALGAPDANMAYVFVSLAATALLVPVIYLVGVWLYSRAVGLGAALLAATAVAPWAYSGIAYPYTVLALGSAVLGGLCWHLRHERLPPWLAGLLFGLLAGFRQDLLLFLGPLFLDCLGRPHWRRYLTATLGGLAGCLAWFIPTVLASGGFAAFIGALTRQTALVERDTSVTSDGLQGLLWNLHHLRVFLVEQTLMWATVPLFIYVLYALRPNWLARDPAARHLLVWSLPALLFYTFIHLGDVGYVFSLAPPLFIAAGAGAVVLSGWAARLPRLRHWRLALPLGVTLTPALLAWSLATAGPALYNDYYVHHTGHQYSLLWMRCRDGTLAHGIKLIRERYRPEETVLMAAGYYQHARHYLPEYQAWLYEPLIGDEFRRPVPPGVRHVVAFGYRMKTYEQPNEERIIVSCDSYVSIFHVQPGQTVVYRPDELWIE